MLVFYLLIIFIWIVNFKYFLDWLFISLRNRDSICRLGKIEYLFKLILIYYIFGMIWVGFGVLV